MRRIDSRMFRRQPGPYGRRSGMPPGGAALMCAMAALCLSGLSLLSLNTAAAAKRLSDACVGSVKGYYGACLEADRDLAAARAAGETLERHEGMYRISGQQALYVEYSVGADGSCHIHKWKQARDGGWEPDTGLDVIK